MEFSPEQIQAFGVALNEATLLGADLNVERREAALSFAALALPVGDGPAPEDPRVVLILSSVGRVAASLRNGRWDDAKASVEPFEAEALSDVVMSFNGLPVYGWEFLDVSEADNFTRWADRLSLDWRSRPDGLSHTLDVFQEGARHLDVRFWFDELRIFTWDQEEIAFDDFTAAGVRWWDGLYARDPRTSGHGIQPLSKEQADG